MSPVMSALLDDLVRAAASEVLAVRGLDPASLPADAGVGRPRDPAHGEYATSVALRTARRLGVPPRELAGWLADALVRRPEVAGAEVAGPGFLNLRMTAVGRAAVIAEAMTCEFPDILEMRTVAEEAAAPDELVAAVGAEAARYAVLRSPTGVIGDVAVLGRRVPGNPLYQVQYAHARLVALSRNAADLGVVADPGPLTGSAEVALVGHIAEFPAVVRSGEPHRLARHLETLAGAVLDFHASCAVLPRGDEDVTQLHRARLAAVLAARRVLANGLGLLSMNAPERM
jgi:arginyl-tRNA synthetase